MAPIQHLLLQAFSYRTSIFPKTSLCVYVHLLRDIIVSHQFTSVCCKISVYISHCVFSLNSGSTFFTVDRINPLEEPIIIFKITNSFSLLLLFFYQYLLNPNYGAKHCLSSGDMSISKLDLPSQILKSEGGYRNIGK